MASSPIKPSDKQLASNSKVKIKESTTHFYMNDKNLKEINLSGTARHTKVLYLQNNQITTIQNLIDYENLTHLYLQWNKISKIENLNCLKNLRKLYLGYNMINRLENIEKLSKLKELHIEKQNLKNASFTFEVNSMKSVAKNLQILNVSDLKLKSLEPISVLYNLRQLIANGNELEDASEIGRIFGRMRMLEKANLAGCPMQRDIHYKEKIIAGTNNNLHYLNGKIISPVTRVFINRFFEIKNKRNCKSGSIEIKRKSGKDTETLFNPLNIQCTGDELGFRAWNSLNSSQKQLHRAVKSETTIKTKTGYSLQGRHIANEQNQ